MTPTLPRLLLMCLALAFASIWLGCGPEELEEEDASGELIVSPDDEMLAADLPDADQPVEVETD